MGRVAPCARPAAWALAVVAALSSAAGCGPSAAGVGPGPVQLPAGTAVDVPLPGLAVVGPTTEVCLVFPAETYITRTREGATVQPNAIAPVLVDLGAALVGADGAARAVPFAGVSIGGGRAELCLDAPGAPGTRYRAVRLRASRPLGIRQVRWWSGKRVLIFP